MANECSICKKEGILVEVIGNEKIMSVCERCAEKNDFPIIRRPTQEQIALSHKYYGARRFPLPIIKGISKEDMELKKIIVNNVKPGDYKELIDNFHWQIMHSRRLKKISLKQLSEAIAEPEVVLEMAEKGRLPDNYERLVNKLEQYLGINLWRDERNKKKELDKFDIEKTDLSNVTIADIRRLQSNKSSEEQKKQDNDRIEKIAPDEDDEFEELD
ncbi:MAG: hypothetical protein WC533_02985 [Candidatus Pacearchaeota archaeon]